MNPVISHCFFHSSTLSLYSVVFEETLDLHAPTKSSISSGSTSTLKRSRSSLSLIIVVQKKSIRCPICPIFIPLLNASATFADLINESSPFSKIGSLIEVFSIYL